MLSYRATVDVPSVTVRTVSRWLAAHRRSHDARPHQRAATPWVQAVMLLRWLIEATSTRTPTRDARISLATAYRYLHEALQVICCVLGLLEAVMTGRISAHGTQGSTRLSFVSGR